MSLGSQLLARLAHLPPARLRAVVVERDLRATMSDGVILLADRYYPRGDPHAPIVLLRSPYGRRTAFGLIGRIFAERGYQAVVQSVRGTFGSGGAFDAMRYEAEDGRATLAWLAEQPWFGGSLAMTGPSYLGFVQWAVATGAPDYLKALAPQITASQFRGLTYPGEAFGLKTALSWIYQLEHQEESFWRLLGARRRQNGILARALATLPLAKADTAAVGHPVKFYQDWLAHNTPGDPFWQEIDYSQHLDRVAAPVNLVAGWYDIFLPSQLADYAALRAAGREPYLTIGPWKHTSLGVFGAALRESLMWCDAHLRGDASGLRAAPVRVFVMGARRWLDLPSWPPPATPTRWYLQPDRALGSEAPDASQRENPPDTYRYDPASPTPAVGGIVLTADAGPRDNRRLETRPDVLTYTTPPLENDLDIIGPVAAELYVTSSREHTDFFVRLCDVAPGGRSINICDGQVRLWPGRFPPASDGTMRLAIDLWPTACRFARGHRLRLQVSSGAHPRFSRNPGTGEALGNATTLVAADQSVYHDEEHPSCLVLPVYSVQKTPSHDEV